MLIDVERRSERRGRRIVKSVVTGIVCDYRHVEYAEFAPAGADIVASLEGLFRGEFAEGTRVKITIEAEN